MIDRSRSPGKSQWSVHEASRELALAEARRWHADRLVERYESLFRSFRMRA